MEDKHSPKSKPLRQAVNFGRDLANAYKESETTKRTDDMKEQEDRNENTQNLQDSTENGNNGNNNEEDNTIEIHLPQSFKKEKKEKEELVSRIETLENEKAELKEMLLHKAAELENFRKRSLREKQDLIDYANERLLFQMLAILDDLGNALNVASRNADYDSLIKGVELIYQKAKKLFEDAGVQEMEEPAGKPFDVNYHEAMMMMNSDLPEAYVVQEVQKGYLIRDKVLRHSKVITSSGVKPE